MFLNSDTNNFLEIIFYYRINAWRLGRHIIPKAELIHLVVCVISNYSPFVVFYSDSSLSLCVDNEVNSFQIVTYVIDIASNTKQQ